MRDDQLLSERGLLPSLQHFLANEHDRLAAQKRGGAIDFVPLGPMDDTHAGYTAADDSTPERLFEKKWAEALLDQARAQVRAEFQRTGKSRQFESLRMVLTAGEPRVRYGELAASLGISEGAVKVAVHRLRRRFRERLHEAVAETVSDPAEVDDELRYLRKVFGE